MPLLPYDKDLYTIYSMTTIDYFNRPNAHLLPYPLLSRDLVNFDNLSLFHKELRKSVFSGTKCPSTQPGRHVGLRSCCVQNACTPARREIP
jgi:hypothetical protein